MAYLRKKAAERKIQYVAFQNGFFFEWGLENGIIGFNFKDKTATIYDGGEVEIDSVTTNKLGEAVARILLDPTPYLNRHLYLTTVAFKQNDILRLIEEKTSSKWTVKQTTTAGTIEAGTKLLESDFMTGATLIIPGIQLDTTERFAPRITRRDAEELGLAKDDVNAILDRIIEV